MFLETPGLIKTIGVVSDTHIQNRLGTLPVKLFSVFRNAGVDFICHAGDICTLSVLRELEHIAPVRAVRGNRDLHLKNKLPLIDQIEAGKVRIGLIHSHTSFLRYLVDKLRYYRDGYRFERYAVMLHRVFPQADVVIFGHTHIAESRYWQGKLYLNPGSCINDPKGLLPTCGILRVFNDGSVKAEIVEL